MTAACEDRTLSEPALRDFPLDFTGPAEAHGGQVGAGVLGEIFAEQAGKFLGRRS